MSMAVGLCASSALGFGSCFDSGGLMQLGLCACAMHVWSSTRKNYRTWLAISREPIKINQHPHH